MPVVIRGINCLLPIVAALDVLARVVWLRSARLSDVQEGLGKRVVSDLERGDLLVLVGGDGDELRLLEAHLGHPLAHVRVEPVNDNARLILVQRIQLDLSLVGRFVGQLDLCHEMKS